MFFNLNPYGIAWFESLLLMTIPWHYLFDNKAIKNNAQGWELKV